MKNKKNLNDFIHEIIEELKGESRFGTAHIYRSTLNMFCSFCKCQKIPFGQLNRIKLKQFENHLRDRMLSWNTISTYMRTLRSTYNKAVDQGFVIDNSRLFRQVYTGVKANFKRDAGLTDLKNDAQLALSENSEYKKKRSENSIQLRLIQFLTEYAVNPDHAYEVLPVNVGLTDRGLASPINRYNEMQLERRHLLRTSSESNPAMANLDGSICAMRNNVQTTIINVQKGLLINQTDLQRQAGKYTGRITNVPKLKRQLGSISRQQEIRARLYLMLLQKREENAITLALYL